jgi:hypothetical protein
MDSTTATDTTTAPATTIKYVDHLDVDPPIRNQEFACVTFVGPTGNQKSDVLGFKIRGVFRTIEEARAHIKRIQSFDSDFDIFICSVGAWCPFAPDPSAIPEQEHRNEILNNLVKGYRENRYLAEEEEIKRKHKLMREAMLDGLPERQKELANKKEHPVSVKDKLDTLPDKIKGLRIEAEEMEKKYNSAQETWKSFTEEEINAAMKELEEFKALASGGGGGGSGGGGSSGGDLVLPDTTTKEPAPEQIDEAKIEKYKKERVAAIADTTSLIERTATK